MVPAFMYFMLLVSCLRVSSQDGNGQLCMNCKNLKNPGECTQITRCGIHEQCFMSQYMRNGQLYYDLGCQDNTLCSKLSGVFGRRANPGLDNYEDDVTSVVCVACCNDTICNIGGLCNVPAFNQHGGRVCFNCKDATSPDGCRHIKLCGIDRQCYIHQKIDPNTFNFEWESGCAESAGHCTRSSAYFCRQCCSGNLCNSRCSRTHVTHPTQHAKIHLNQGGTCFDDAHTNCTEYAYKTICDRYGQYVKWAKLKCPATCGYCIAPTVTVNCIDAKPNCAEYEHAMCTEDQYRVFRELNCRRFCGVCHDLSRQLCMNCKNLKQPGQCTQVTQCGIHEQCLMTQYMRNGQMYYDLGCRSNAVCNKITSILGRRASPGLNNYEDDDRSVLCDGCCKDALCNIGGLCGTSAFNYHGGHFCFNCNNSTTPDNCRQIMMCRFDQQCYIHQKLDPNTYEIVWETGCTTNIGHCKRSSAYYCHQCCTGNLCNSRCSHFSNITPQITQQSTYVTQAPTMTVNCVDAIPDCAEYEDAMCIEERYRGFRELNCRKFCGVCQGGTCFDDAHTNCTEYTYKTICDRYGQYVRWAKLKCPATCGYCIAPTVTVNCVDAIPNCAEYVNTMCTEDKYRKFRELNCRKFCGVCHGVDHHLLTQAP